MVLWEFFTFLIITALIFAFSGTWGLSLYRGTQRDCQELNAALLTEQREGPLRKCER